jgi:hypothetical protein
MLKKVNKKKKLTYQQSPCKAHEANHGNLVPLPDVGLRRVIIWVILGVERPCDGANIVDV